MNNMTLAQRDLYLVRIEEELNKKKEFLLNKYNHLGEMEEDNEYLKVIRNDYTHYYDYIQKEKQDQVEAMNLLRTYIDELIVDGKMTDKDLESAEKEQEKILTEIDVIKNDLDKITEKIDIVDVFRPSKEAPGFANEAVKIGGKVLWLQYGIQNDEAQKIAEDNNIKYISNRCIKQEYQKLFQKSNPVFPALKK